MCHLPSCLSVCLYCLFLNSQLWGEEALRKAADWASDGVVVCLQAAGQSGVLLPARAIHVLAGSVIKDMHEKGAQGHSPYACKCMDFSRLTT